MYSKIAPKISCFLFTFFFLCQTGFTDVVLDTTITITDPASGEQTLGFPKLGFNLVYKAVLKGQCPASSYEGSLYAENLSGVTVKRTGEDSAALFITFGHCENNPVTIADVDGKTFQITTSSRTINLAVSDAANNQIQFVFDDPAVGVVPRQALHLNFEPESRHFNLSGRTVPTDNRVTRQIMFQKH